MNYAIKEKDSNRMVAIVDDAFAAWFTQNMPDFDVVEIGSVGSSTFTTDKGTISTISAQPVGGPFLKDAFHLISSKPADISLADAYKLIQ